MLKNTGRKNRCQLYFSALFNIINDRGLLIITRGVMENLPDEARAVLLK
jgi:hypothetical protein